MQYFSNDKQNINHISNKVDERKSIQGNIDSSKKKKEIGIWFRVTGLVVASVRLRFVPLYEQFLFSETQLFFFKNKNV